ncbi:MAG: hypothetical protein PVH68_11965 [Armatimonadota bacterium]
MLDRRRAMTTVLAIALCTGTLQAQQPQRDLIFSEDFADVALPKWQGTRLPAVKLAGAQGPGGIPALTMETREPVSGNLSASLPIERIAGKAVLLEVWRKAEDVKTGAQHYYNAKSMLSWKAKGAPKPSYSTTTYSDFSGTFDWERHQYVMEMPKDLEWARVSIGMQACTGKAGWAGLTVSVDPRFPNQQALERFVAEEERRRFANLNTDALEIRRLSGGIIQVFAQDEYVPRRFWNDAVREAVLAAVPEPEQKTQRPLGEFRAQLSLALQARARELEAGLRGLQGNALNDRIYEIASLRERVRQIRTDAAEAKNIRLKASASESPVSPLIFGNNINTQNLTAPYDSARGKFQDEFLRRVRPMGITFLRYPGGCNADVFNWKDTVGPLDKRKDIINYHNGTSRGIASFGVDEYLRFCEEEGMVPIITTAFCKDRPDKVDPNDHPTGIRHEFVFSYLKTAPERVQLAADWVEYCNAAVDTPLGRLRAENGHAKPYNVKYWEIGNESYGPDPTGSCSAREYAEAFPAYVQAMKGRDPSVQIVMNGCGHDMQWNDTLLRISGRHADAYQFHFYRTPRVGDYSKLEGRPHQVSSAMRLADNIPGILSEVEGLMRKHLGRTLPIIISEFGMGNARDREFMTSVTSPVLVADMWRTLIESPAVFGANKWCLFTGYWFSQIQGPTLQRPDAPYYNRPEQIMHVIYARCRAETRLAVNNEVSEGAKAVVFKQPETYGIVLISREAVDWQSITLEIPGARGGRATCLLLAAGHPMLGNENDHDLIGGYEFEFDYTPGEPIALPPSSVMGLIVGR